MTRGHRGSLALRCAIPSFLHRRFIPALPDGVATREPECRHSKRRHGLASAGPRLRRSSLSRRPATRSSSPRRPGCATSSSVCRLSCAPRCPTATWPRSSSKPSPRSSRGSRLGASPGRKHRGRRPLRPASSPRTRQVPAAVKRAVHERDGGPCRYQDERGRRCTARQDLEFHHLFPFSATAAIIRWPMSPLMCRGHNLYLAELDYGRESIARQHRRPTSKAPTPNASP